MNDTRTIWVECGRGSGSDFMVAEKYSGQGPHATSRRIAWFEKAAGGSDAGFSFTCTASKVEEQPVKRRK